MTPVTTTIYTCCLGKCDSPTLIHHLASQFPSVSFVAYVDYETAESFAAAGWQTFILDQCCTHSLIHQSNCLRIKSRIPKLCPSSVGISTDYALWIDANVVLTSESLELMLSYINQSHFPSLACFLHPKRSSLLPEILHCYSFGKLSLKSLLFALRYNFPNLLLQHTVFWGGVLLWNLRSNSNIEFFHNELLSSTSFIGRDQIVFYTAARISNIIITPLPAFFISSFIQSKHIFYQKHSLDPFSKFFTSIVHFFYKFFKPSL